MRALVTILMTGWASVAGAQGLLSLESTQTGGAWEGVGRLEVSEDVFCTGALIAERLVLTAAHCIFDAKTGAAIPAADMQFRAGWRNGRAAAYRQVRRAVPHPGFAPTLDDTAVRVANDIALLELQHPIRSAAIRPFETDTRPLRGDTVGVVSYAHGRAEAPSLQESCAVLGTQRDMLILSCTVDFGASGSPVFRIGEDGAPRIVSVISAMARADGRPVSLGTALEYPLGALFEAFDGDTGGLDSVSLTAGTRRDTGAKFVAP